MKIKFPLLIAALSLALFSCQTKVKKTADSIDAKVDSIVSLMTLEEKIGQLTLFTSDMDQTGAFIRKEYEEDIKQGRVGSIFNAYGAEYTRKLQTMAIENTRMKIPLLFGYDVIHGHRTIFPMPLAEAASWDLEIIEKSARIAAIEATAEGLHWTFAPMADVTFDPRWGRIVEGAGEDTYLASLISAARVKGFQGDDLSDINTLVACVKHFAAYGASQAGRDYHSVDMSERMLREVYLPPYKAALDAGAMTVMTSFNDLNGIPATASKYLMTEILREEWGFEGFVVTDYTSIMELMYHGVAGDTLEASLLSIKAGVDMDMQAGFYNTALARLVESKQVDEELINIAVRRILKVKYLLGLFDDPYRYCSTEREANEIMTPEFIETARDVARKSIVLLKNEKQLLPLNPATKTIAVIGPLSESRRDLIGSWSAAGDWAKSTTLLEGIKARVPDARILHAQGCDIDGNSKDGFAQAIAAARQADVVVLALGEAYWMSGEAASRSDIGLPGVQQQLAEAIHATGKPVVAVLMNGRPLTINWIDENIPAILETWFLGTTTGHAIADVLFGDYNPSGKLPVTFPKNVGQIPIHYNMKNTGRPFEANNKYTTKYLDVTNEPLYPFGFGLSYTTFAYGEVELSKSAIGENETLTASVNITNTGSYAGEEVIQLYIHDKVASVARPVKELKGFKKISLQPGESQKVSFEIGMEALSFYRADMSFGVERGDFEVMIGGNSVDTKSAFFSLK
ncbi:MAG: glycoside hydrolase family 3 N-terminal domain-containing protein [Bacteroidales bacterium]|nr:glycoside hydrolase family 3 N-terminal domain-containing protein [Bacteroidales bacterium]